MPGTMFGLAGELDGGLSFAETHLTHAHHSPPLFTHARIDANATARTHPRKRAQPDATDFAVTDNIRFYF